MDKQQMKEKTMTRKQGSQAAAALAIAVTAGFAPAAWSADDVGALRQRLDSLQQEVQALKAALEAQRGPSAAAP